MNPIRLTQTVQKGGCAAKVAASELRKILKEIRFPKPRTELLVDGSHFDDAAIWKVNEQVALVQTIDFFTPIVDDPTTFGRVAACNALSDVYAMGGRPITAMAVLAFPLTSLPSEVITEVLQGASDMIGEAGACFVGGHSIDDDTLKFGLSVTGTVNPARIWSNQGARTGDALILTKPLGTGTLTAALKRDEVNEAGISEGIRSMTQLNNIIDFLNEADLASIHAATDITGFGLSGHSLQMARASQKRFEFTGAEIPSFDLAKDLLEREFLTKAHRTNREYTAESLDDRGLEAWQKLLIHDPQTSGGLLLSVEHSRAESLLKTLKAHFPKTARVGQVVGQADAKSHEPTLRFR